MQTSCVSSFLFYKLVTNFSWSLLWNSYEHLIIIVSFDIFSLTCCEMEILKSSFVLWVNWYILPFWSFDTDSFEAPASQSFSWSRRCPGKWFILFSSSVTLQTMDKLKQTGRNPGSVFNIRSGCMHDLHLFFLSNRTAKLRVENLG